MPQEVESMKPAHAAATQATASGRAPAAPATAAADESRPAAENGDRTIGLVVQVIGPVLDVQFQPDALPEIHTALRLDSEGGEGAPEIHLTAEVQQHLGRNRVRAVSMSSWLVSSALWSRQRVQMPVNRDPDRRPH